MKPLDEETPLIFRQPGVQVEQESMPSGVYRPFVHGELSIEYRKSLQSSRRKDADNGVTQNGNIEEKVDEYIAPGLSIFFILFQTLTIKIKYQKKVKKYFFL